MTGNPRNQSFVVITLLLTQFYSNHHYITEHTSAQDTTLQAGQSCVKKDADLHSPAQDLEIRLKDRPVKDCIYCVVPADYSLVAIPGLFRGTEAPIIQMLLRSPTRDARDSHLSPLPKLDAWRSEAATWQCKGSLPPRTLFIITGAGEIQPL